jgi:hypothetical protein
MNAMKPNIVFLELFTSLQEKSMHKMVRFDVHLEFGCHFEISCLAIFVLFFCHKKSIKCPSLPRIKRKNKKGQQFSKKFQNTRVMFTRIVWGEGNGGNNPPSKNE